MSEQVWILDDDNAIRWVIEKSLTSVNISNSSFVSAESLWHALVYSKPQIIISDIRMPGTDGLSLLERLQQNHPDIPVIIITAHSDLDSAVNAYQAGAFEYLSKPFDIDELTALAERALSHANESRSSKQIKSPLNVPEIIGEAASMQDVFRSIGRLSRSSMSVLINGQSGTGKELVAKALHKHSPRHAAPFIAINVAAIPNELIEAELFGHEKGAFTGANSGRIGRFEQANGGTLFLDEIGDMPLDVQTRLLRVLAEGHFYRVGGHEPVEVDVRIVAATHQNLQDLVARGDFRDDLFHRLNVIRIQLPSLAERQEDIPKLAQHFMQLAAKEINEEPKTLTAECLETMKAFAWPGNVRQLENTCRWLTVMASGQEVLSDDLPEDILTPQATTQVNTMMSWQEALAAWVDVQLENEQSELLHEVQLQTEQILFSRALKHTRGHKQEAAKLLGCGRNTLTRKIKELSI
ncbi:nitrogen regulation protein NR(I) [Parashewanella spongiae]|uniref:DNA-binding transcriptional regulator NtrC n=1 Tax=Parashewanella spongiae TaxID=342950 RepID=A0A3A6TVP0_9GAMM|nr:nitrogen regulation protein NR(I) [Parashewanella spongiae]MCL1078082.1 nitrogen regulation protein NR(I) [Parashewanella spongiae]RJY16955.1 nitrogen regulation protein NR(I) [Parashewanella spongiae]